MGNRARSSRMWGGVRVCGLVGGCACARESAWTRGARAQNRSEEKKGQVESEGLHLPTLKKTTSCVTQNPLRLGPNQSLAGSGVTACATEPASCFLRSGPTSCRLWAERSPCCGIRGWSSEAEGVTAPPPGFLQACGVLTLSDTKEMIASYPSHISGWRMCPGQR